MGMGGWVGPQGTNRMEVDGIVLSRQRPELLRAQGLSAPQQGHVLWAAEGQGGKAEWPAGMGWGGERGAGPRGAAPLTLPHPPTRW